MIDNTIEETEINNNTSKKDLDSCEITRQSTLLPNDTEDDELVRILYKYKQLYDSGAINSTEYEKLKADLLNKHKGISTTNPRMSVIILWICNICNLLGITVNIIESLSKWGDLYSMYKYIMYGYIVGFIVIACFTPAIIVLSLKLSKEHKDDKSVKAASIGGMASIALTSLLMVLSVFL